MNKFKIVGVVNFILGFLQITSSLVFLVFTLPKLNTLYSDFGTKPPSLETTYFMLAVLMLIGVGNLFLGMKLFAKLVNNKYFLFGLVWAIVSFLLMGLLMSIASLSTILPIYNMTSEF